MNVESSLWSRLITLIATKDSIGFLLLLTSNSFWLKIKNQYSMVIMVTENDKVILKSRWWNYAVIEKFLEIEPFWDGRRGMIDAGIGQRISNVRIILHERNSKMQHSFYQSDIWPVKIQNRRNWTVGLVLILYFISCSLIIIYACVGKYFKIVS